MRILFAIGIAVSALLLTSCTNPDTSGGVTMQKELGLRSNSLPFPHGSCNGAPAYDASNTGCGWVTVDGDFECGPVFQMSTQAPTEGPHGGWGGGGCTHRTYIKPNTTYNIVPILNDANLTGANLTNAVLTGAHLGGANLTDANLSGASMRRSKLANANLTNANFYKADLVGTYMTHADLTNANLTGARLNGANLTGANLTGAMLRGVRTMDLIHASSSTICPNGINWGTAGNNCGFYSIQN